LALIFIIHIFASRNSVNTIDMKKLFAFIIVISIVILTGSAFGQDATKNKNDKKGGFAVGGYDQSRKAKEPTRSIIVKEEAEKSEKDVEAEKSNEDGVKAEAPAPAMEAKEAPAAVRPKEKEKGKQGNAYDHSKGGTNGKNLGKARSSEAKSKPKPKNDSKTEVNQK
jgi:hypothetical protein